jgi:hypothetical protein
MPPAGDAALGRSPSPLGGDDGFPRWTTPDELFSGRYHLTRIRDPDHRDGSVVWLVRPRGSPLRYFAKRHPDASNEVILSCYHEELGYGWPRARFPIPGRIDLVLVEYVEQAPAGGRLLGTGLQTLGRVSDWTATQALQLLRTLRDPLEPVQLTLNDLIAAQTDRHPGNLLVVYHDPPPAARARSNLFHPGQPLGTMQLVPVDHLASLGRTTPTSLRATTLVHRPFPHLAARAVEFGLVTGQQVAAEYDRLLEAWTRVAATVELPGIYPERARFVRGLLADRLKLLAEERTQNLRLLTTPRLLLAEHERHQRARRDRLTGRPVASRPLPPAPQLRRRRR